MSITKRQESLQAASIHWSIVIAIAVVISIHGALFIELSLPRDAHVHSSATFLRRTHAWQEHSTNTVILRFIQLSPDDATPSTIQRRTKLTTRVLATPARLPASSKEKRKTKNKQQVAEAHLPSRPKTLDLAVHHHRAHKFTIGRNLTKDALTRHNVLLPGGQAVAGAPHFRMIDPRSRGIAGAVQFIRRNLKIPDSHCFDLDVWLTMSVSQRAAHGVSPHEIEKIKNKYDCVANKYHPRRVGSPWLRGTPRR